MMQFKSIRNLTLGAVFFYWALNHLDLIAHGCSYLLGLFFPFILGSAIAFVLNVPMSFIEQKLSYCTAFQSRKHGTLLRVISYILTLIIIGIVLLLVLNLVMPELLRTVRLLGAQIPYALASLERKLSLLSIDNATLSSIQNIFQLDWQQIGKQVFDFVQKLAGGLFTSSLSVITTVAGTAASSLIAFIFSVYLLMQKEQLAQQAKRLAFAFLSQKHAQQLIATGKLTAMTFSKFIAGQCIEACILGSMFLVSMLILKLPYALLISVLICVTALIPILGSFIGCIVGVFLILLVSPLQALGFLILFFVLQQIEGNLIYPHVVGSSIGLPGIWVLMAVTIGGSLMGVVGMLLFIPLCSVLFALLKQRTAYMLSQKNISDLQ